MKKGKQPAYVLLPTLLILSAISLGYILQSRALTQRLQATKAVIQQEEVDTLQILGATAYHRSGQTVGANKRESASYEVFPAEKRIQIRMEGQQFDRPLRMP